MPGYCRETVKACLVLRLLLLAEHLHGHQGHTRRDSEAVGLRVKVTKAQVLSVNRKGWDGKEDILRKDYCNLNIRDNAGSVKMCL